MFDFSNVKIYSDDGESTDKKNLDIGTVLKNIDNANFDFYDSLSTDEQKQFQPYTALRWVSSLDDSTAVTYKAKNVESVVGKWTSGGKEVLNELREEINSMYSGACTSVSKYEHAKYDWRIKFSVKDSKSADLVKSTLLEMGISSCSTECLISKESAQYQLILLNNMVNVNFWEIQKHPELVYSILCSVQGVLGEGELKRNWLPFCKGIKNINKDIFGIMQEQCSTDLSRVNINMDEYVILLNSYSTDEFKQLLQDLGKTESETKSLMKTFKAEIQKYGKSD